METAYNTAMGFLGKHAPAIAEQLVITNATTTQQMLYPDVNLEALNWLERLWANYYIYMGNAILATGVMSFVLHEVSREWRAWGTPAPLVQLGSDGNRERYRLPSVRSTCLRVVR